MKQLLLIFLLSLSLQTYCMCPRLFMATQKIFWSQPGLFFSTSNPMYDMHGKRPPKDRDGKRTWKRNTKPWIKSALQVKIIDNETGIVETDYILSKNELLTFVVPKGKEVVIKTGKKQNTKITIERKS